MTRTPRNSNLLVAVILAILLLSGFRAFVPQSPWSVSEADPYLWLKICPEAEDYTFSNLNIPADDKFGAADASTIREIAASVVDDFNNVSTSYLRLELLDAGEDGAEHEGRLIEYCGINNDGGAAKIDWVGNKAKGCQLTIGGKDSASTKYFTTIFTHELGHCLGLGHPQDTKQAVMSYFRDANTYRLKTDDKMGLSYLYPTADSKKAQATLGLSCTRKH